MKKILLLIALSFTIKAFSQVNLIDYTTVQPAAPYTNVLTMTIPGVATNVQVTIITTNSEVGDSMASAAAKINGNFQFVTNGNVTAGGVLQGLATNASFSATGILTINGYGSTLTSSNATVTITRSYSNNRTNYDLSFTGASGSATNAIGNLNGLGTNTTLISGIYFETTNFVAGLVNPSSVIPPNLNGITSITLTNNGESATWGTYYYDTNGFSFHTQPPNGYVVYAMPNPFYNPGGTTNYYEQVDVYNDYTTAYKDFSTTNLSPVITFEYPYGGQWYNAHFPGGTWTFHTYIPGNPNPTLTVTPTALYVNTNSISYNYDGTRSIINEFGSMNNTGGYYVNGIPINQAVVGTTNSNPTNPTNGVPGLTFDPATTGYFSNCDSSITTNFNGYTVSSFYSTLPNYYQYNPLPPGAYFTVIPTGHQYVQPSSGAIFNSYQYTLYSPNFNTTKTVFQTPLQSLTAVNNLVLNLKAAGLWNLFTNYALYPFASTHSDCNAVNLMGTNYTIVWNGFLATSTAHGTWGVSNGISSLGYGDTGFKITNSAWTNLTLMAFVESSGSATNYLLSSFDLTNRADLWTIGMTNLMSTLNTTNDATNSFAWDTNGTFFSVTRQLPSVENGLIDFTNFYSRTANTNSEPSSNIVLFAQSAGFNESSNLVLGFAAILPRITTNQLATLQNIVIQYEVAMGRYPQANISYSTNTLPTSVLAGTTVTSTGSAVIIVPSQNANGTTNFDLGATWRAGEVTVGSSGTSTSVTFSRPFPPSVGTNYSLTFGTGSGFATFPNPEWSTKTTNGFTLITTAVVGGGIEDYTAMANQ
ncbi:MAG: hypothetical protein KGL39_30240 [Patescibacteria group bacterium]|nr:hypothetical protein [Patescibacteria group bacterium]